MAALSLSATPPNSNNNSSSSSSSSNMRGGSSKENATPSKAAVTPLGANSKAFGKIIVHNVLSESGANALQQHISNQNTIIRKIRDFGMLGAVQSAAAATSNAPRSNKRALATCSKTNSSSSNSSSSSNNKRVKLNKKQQAPQQQQSQPAAAAAAPKVAINTLALVQRIAGTPGRKGLPLPQAVARRNARERNRVKQVNNGFAALRERIPEEVSVAFEAQGAGRGASKKLSKVETLRMAVEYIRSLERLLGFDFPPLGGANSSSSGDDSFMFIKDEFDCLDEQFDDSLSNYELEEQQQQQPQSQQQPQPQELLPSVTSLNGLQYVRIPGTSTYQLLTPDILDANSSSLDEEQFNALIDTNCLSNSSTAAAAAAATATACVNLSRSPVPTSPSPISPTTTTSTVSPVAIAVANELLLQACAAQQQQQQQQQQQLIKQEYSEGDFVPNNNNSRSPNSSHNYAQPQPQQQQQQSTAEEQLLCSPVLPAFYDQEPQQSFYDNVVVGLPSFKKEFTDVLHDQSNNNTAGCLSDESMIDAIDWWEAHTPKSDAPGL